jgi:tetrahedral aminopeptidase
MNLDLLKRLCETPGVPGQEQRVRALIEAEVEGLFDEIRTDAMGSLLCRRDAARPKGKKGGDPTRIMLLCHMDEIGFLVSHVTDKGWIHVQPVGGFDPRNLFSRRVLVCTEKGDLKGVMNPGGPPDAHLLGRGSQEDPRAARVLRRHRHGRQGLRHGAGRRHGGDGRALHRDRRQDRIKALDNRIACWLGIEAIRGLGKKRGSAEIHVAFTCQEEVGLRGARTSAHAVRPDIGIGVDTTLACDTPGVPEQDRTTEQGKGFGLHVRDGSFIADRGLVAEFEALAKKKKIPFQRTMLRAGGQDGAAAQQAASGARAIGIVVGTRYIHTVTEMIHRSDLKAARDMLVAYLEQA